MVKCERKCWNTTFSINFLYNWTKNKTLLNHIAALLILRYPGNKFSYTPLLHDYTFITYLFKFVYLFILHYLRFPLIQFLLHFLYTHLLRQTVTAEKLDLYCPICTKWTKCELVTKHHDNLSYLYICYSQATTAHSTKRYIFCTNTPRW